LAQEENITVSDARHDERDAVLVSACLIGVCCRYDGTSREEPRVVADLAGTRMVPICPEQMGGMSTPRVPCDLVGGDGAAVLEGRARVVDKDGVDRTANFKRGAEESLKLARKFGARRAVLKARSPSCGVASGVTAALLKKSGITVESAG
jgi:uncharacterized protein YbbK (DUF523 family)